MAQHSDDAPKQPRRRSVLPPFVAPRTPQATSSTRERDAAQRRTSHPFAAPDVAAAAQSTEAPAADFAAAEPESPATNHPDGIIVAEDVPQSSDRELVVEPVEPEPISLRITGEQPAVEGAPIQVFEYGESESSLDVRASAERLDLEPTEFSLDSASAGKELQVESFWASEPFASVHSEPPAGGDFLSDDAAVESSREEPLHGDVAGSGTPALEWHGSNAEAEDPYNRHGEPAPTQVASSGEGLETTPADDEDSPEAADVAAFVAAAFAPDLEQARRPQVGDRSEQAHVSDLIRDTATARDELDAGLHHAAAEPAKSPEATEWTSPWSEATIGAPDQVADAASRLLSEVEPWALPPNEPTEVNPQEAIAAALERVAHRIRVGEVILAPDTPPTSDEAAVAAALAALLRVPRG